MISDEREGPLGICWEEDATAALADLLQVDTEHLLRSLGGMWRSLMPNYRPDEFVDDLPPHDWFVFGEPLQVLLGVEKGRSVHALVASARAVRFDSSLDGSVLPHACRVVLEGNLWLDRLAEAVRDVAKRSRRSFFWCSVCRTCNSPDERHEGSICGGCTERYWDAVS